MKVKRTTKLGTDVNVLALGLFEDSKGAYKQLNKELDKELQEAAKCNQCTGKFGSLYATKVNHGKVKRVLVIGLGKKEDFTAEKLRKVVAKAFRYTNQRKYDTLSLNIPSLVSDLLEAEEIGRCTAEGLYLTNYKFDKYVTKNEEEPESKVKLVSFLWDKDKKSFDEGFKVGKAISECTNLAKDMVNEPPKVATPTYLHNVAKDISKLKNVKLKVLEKKDMEKVGLGAILGVTAGSDQPPKLIILEYNGAGKSPYTALVGKGITFDTGGYNLKPTGSMLDMKADMAGGAAVLATMKAAATLGLKKNILGVVPSCENAVNGSATKPSDILTAYNKKTIEVTNTDAEGRLILADAMSYIEDKYKPEIIIDIATLTGACIVALGHHIAGLITKDEDLAKKLESAGKDSYDRVWRLPFLEEHEDSMKGSITDLRNTGQRGYGAGTITAGVFLSKFVDKARWAHVDIAGTDLLKEEKDYQQKGASGSGVRLFMYYLLNN